MDLKSMLNDSAAQRPPSLHTPHASYDARATEKIQGHETHSRSQSHGHTHRPMPYPPPLQPVDSRVQSAGGYFSNVSPHPNHLNSASTHASTPTAGPSSAYARSPGVQSQSYTPRDSAGPPSAYSNTPFVPSPSTSVNQPPTPGSAYHHPNHTPLSAHSQTGHPPPFAQAQSQSPRGSNPPNGHPRQSSPNTPHGYPHSATPLGPPVNYNKISPQAQRPPSQGVEQHYRQSSYGSVGSVHGRDSSQPGSQQPAESVHRQSIPDLERVKERERSVSVSPKTIPQPSPYRQMSVSSQTGSLGRPSIQSPSEARAMSNISDVHTGGNLVSAEIKSEHHQTPTPRASTIPGEQQTPLSRGPSMHLEHTDIASSPAPPITLKRNASVMSDQSHTSQALPRKRLKRDEIPVFAQTARTKSARLGTNGSKTRPKRPAVRTLTNTPPQPVQASQASQPAQSSHPSQPTQQPPPLPPPQQQQPLRTRQDSTTNGRPSGMLSPPAEVRSEPCIANIIPYEDLTRRVCDWIYQCIGSAVPPSGGAMFEIEAKIGEISAIDEGRRVSLPVATEAVFDPSKWSQKTRFESSMNAEQHMLLNKYLNEITREAFVQAQNGERQEILYDHPHEIDEFYELTSEGKQNLNPSILEYLQPHRQPRVRRTRDRNTGQMKAQIIKTRIADMEIYNPNTDFDCRISISIESPWDGNPSWLTPMGAANEGRHKDRMSYRHMAYQIDLTQVSHDNKPDMEHELEVEISTEQIRRELDNLQNGRPSKYEDLVRGLIDNVRLLCRKASVNGPRRG